MLLEQAVERTAAGAPIEPDCDLVRGSRVLGREEPEKQLILAGSAVVDGQQAGIGLAKVEGDAGKVCAVDGKLCCRVSAISDDRKME
jgi:hypothetical protein